MDAGVSFLFARIREKKRMELLRRPLEVLPVESEIALMEQTMQAWHELPCEDGKHPVLRVFAPFVAGVSASALPPDPHRSVIQAFREMIGSGRLFSPSGRRMDCFFRSFFLGHQHVEELYDGYPEGGVPEDLKAAHTAVFRSSGMIVLKETCLLSWEYFWKTSWIFP
eukprot:gene17471-23775_t